MNAISCALNAEKKDYKELISLANQMIYHLLSIDKLTFSEQNLLCNLIEVLNPHTRDSGHSSSAYSKAYIENTCDYKIARDLVMRFEGNTYEALSHWANHYYFDPILWHKAIEKMIELKAIEGRVYAIGHAQPKARESADAVRQRHWKELMQFNPTWKQIEFIIINTMMPIEFVKGGIEYVIKNNLLEGLKNKAYYMHLFEKTYQPASTMQEHLALFKKEEPALSKLMVA